MDYNGYLTVYADAAHLFSVCHIVFGVFEVECVAGGGMLGM